MMPPCTALYSKLLQAHLLSSLPISMLYRAMSGAKVLTAVTSMVASKGTSSAPASSNAAIAIANVSMVCSTPHGQHFWVLASCCASLEGMSPSQLAAGDSAGDQVAWPKHQLTGGSAFFSIMQHAQQQAHWPPCSAC